MGIARAGWINWLFTGLLTLAAVAGAMPGSGAAQTLTRLYLTADKALVIELKEPATKVAVANPAIADVQVITPTQLLVTGHGAGVTSLNVFTSRSLQSYDLAVHPAPVGAVAAQPLDGAPYAVLVQKADRVTEHLFARDADQRWVELSRKVEAEAPKR